MCLSRGEQMVSDCLDLELQLVISQLTWVLGNKLGSSIREVYALSRWATAPALNQVFLSQPHKSNEGVHPNTPSSLPLQQLQLRRHEAFYCSLCSQNLMVNLQQFAFSHWTQHHIHVYEGQRSEWNAARDRKAIEQGAHWQSPQPSLVSQCRTLRQTSGKGCKLP